MRERIRAAMVREDGVSLIEMLAAILILGVALAAFASSTVSSLQATQRDHRLVIANALATEVVESLQGLPWDQAALYESEATSALGGTAYEGEELVLVPGPRTAGSVLPEPVQTLTRDGFEYEVTTAITWVDDDADDVGAADETGDRDDYKRFTVELEWSLRGKTRDLRVTALRSAETRERPLRAEAPDEVPLDDVACNQVSVDLSATTLDPAVNPVTVSFNLRDGTEATVNLVHGGDARTWSRTLAPSCGDAGPFPDGPVLLTFKAEDRATGEFYEVTEMVVFIRPVAVSSDDIAVSDIEVDEAGRSTCDVTISVDVDGGTPDDTVTATWDSGPEPVDLTFDQLTPAGATFTHLYPAGSEFGQPGEPTVTVNVNRGYDGNTAAGATSTIVHPDDADVC